ncbi:MAG TPA: RidA family protein [Anaerolineae bacterium]|nr:RidA family protein [Anaerolineae bacterium]
MKERIQTSKAPNAIGPYSQAIVTDTLVFCSGQGPMDPGTNTLVEGGVAVQTERTMLNIKALLGEMGLDLGDVVKTTCYLADMDDFKAFNEVYGSFMPEPYPARTTIEAARLPMDIRVEIEVIAQKR